MKFQIPYPSRMKSVNDLKQHIVKYDASDNLYIFKQFVIVAITLMSCLIFHLKAVDEKYGDI